VFSIADLIVVLGAFLLCAAWGALMIGRALRDRTDNPETAGNVVLLAALFVGLAVAGTMTVSGFLETVLAGCC
jgi:NhaP-type Na+/H+ or K+/H+ antiporter